MRGKRNHFLAQDILIIAASIVLAVFLVKTDVLGVILTSTQGVGFLGSFIAGMFFTSVFTTIPAIATFSEIAQVNSLYSTAFFGAVGAVIGDLVIFRFVQDRFSKHVVELVKQTTIQKRFKALFRLRFFRWFTFLVGGLIIASPLPDELGISLLGFSKMRYSWFIPLSFVFNFIGILIVGEVARLI